jgi:predicted Zn-ribbon and HTH transcriptional regulator
MLWEVSTVRQRLRDILREGPRTALELSGECSVAEREVRDHLEHLRKSLPHEGLRLVVEPARCRKCGHEFADRTRLSRPSRCPECRAERIEPPRFHVEDA